MLYLASQSPRRYQLLKQLGLDFKQFSITVDESVLANEKPVDYSKRITLLKLEEAKKHLADTDIVITSDTSVVIGDEILGKPKDFDDAKVMLEKLSNNVHYVYTSVAVSKNDQTLIKNTINKVSFRSISEKEIIAYWQSNEPKDKAGSYAIQGLGGIFVKSISGSYSAIMGLPLYETVNLLKKFGVEVL